MNSPKTYVRDLECVVDEFTELEAADPSGVDDGPVALLSPADQAVLPQEFQAGRQILPREGDETQRPLVL